MPTRSSWRFTDARGRRGATHATEHVVEATRECCPGADILTPLVPIEFWSLQDADLLIQELIDLIDGVWQERVTRGRAYRRVILIGFSFGSVLVRQLFCRAAGARMDGRVDETHARPWIDAVERVVQIAGLNRGWTVDSPVTRIASLSNRIGTAIGHLLPWKPTLVCDSTRRAVSYAHAVAVAGAQAQPAPTAIDRSTTRHTRRHRQSG